nr:radical SAM protein [Desulfurococcales archaeon]
MGGININKGVNLLNDKWWLAIALRLYKKEFKMGTYRIRPPLIKRSRLTTKDKNGVGKDLSTGWAINYAVGCTHGCIFCYVDAIHKRYNPNKVDKEAVQLPWGKYFFVPENLWEAIMKTPWRKWKGEEVLMSSTHDPYLPQLYVYARAILERALRNGVRIRIQTRSMEVLKDLDLLEEYRDRVILQVSIATMNHRFARLIEPGVPGPEKRLRILEEAKERGIETGVIIAPIFPPNNYRPDLERDLENIISRLAEIGVDRVYGEMLHIRGINMRYIREVLGESVKVSEDLDKYIKYLFYRLVKKY